MTSENLVTVAEGTSLEQAEVVLQAINWKITSCKRVVQISGFNYFRDITKLTQKPIANKDVLVVYVAAAIGVTGDCS
jgi:IMP dehydrogenase